MARIGAHDLCDGVARSPPRRSGDQDVGAVGSLLCRSLRYAAAPARAARRHLISMPVLCPTLGAVHAGSGPSLPRQYRSVRQRRTQCGYLIPCPNRTVHLLRSVTIPTSAHDQRLVGRGRASRDLQPRQPPPIGTSGWVSALKRSAWPVAQIAAPPKIAPLHRPTAHRHPAKREPHPPRPAHDEFLVTAQRSAPPSPATFQPGRTCPADRQTPRPVREALTARKIPSWPTVNIDVPARTVRSNPDRYPVTAARAGTPARYDHALSLSKAPASHRMSTPPAGLR